MCSEMSRGERGDSLSVRLSVPAGGSPWTRQLQVCHRHALRAAMIPVTSPLSESISSWSNHPYQVGGEGTVPFLKLRKLPSPKGHIACPHPGQ